MEDNYGKIKSNNTNQRDETMKAKTINVQIVKNLGNYETIRLGGEWELNGENLQDAIRAAVEELEQAWSKPKAAPQSATNPERVETPAPVEKTPQNYKYERQSKDQMLEYIAEENGKKIVRFKEEAKILQAIVNRVRTDKTVTLEIIEEHYMLDDDARKCIEAAIKLRG